MSFNKFISPQTLVVPLGSSFSLYSINTYGLSPTTVTTEDISATPAAQGAQHGPKVVLNKQLILTNIYNKEKLDAMCLCETHQTWYSPPNSSYTDMFVVSGHLYRPLLSSQSWELGGKILGGFGTHPPTFFGAGLSILVFF